ncbi:hypothetical protein AYI69_g3445, partial [Smittium culicis]
MHNYVRENLCRLRNKFKNESIVFPAAHNSFRCIITSQKMEAPGYKNI